MKMPTTGELNRRVTIKDWQDQPNANAGIDQVYSNPVKVWAKVEPVGAALVQGSVQLNDKITHRFYIRYKKGITADISLFLDDIKYRPKRVTDLADKRQFLVIECEELGNYG